MRVWSHIAETLGRGEACALVTVASALGSTPRENGARMIVMADGSYRGTIGGGTLEFEAIHWAQQAVQDRRKGLELRKVSLGPDLGQCCGGRIDVAIEVVETAQLPMAEKFAQQEHHGKPFTTRAVFSEGQPVQRELVVLACADHFSVLPNGELIEVFGTDRRPLYLFGAGHVGKAVVLALASLPFEITWLDSRPEVFPSAVPVNVRKQLINRTDASVSACLASAPAGAFVLAMTHSHSLDEEIMASALAQQRFAYCGVIGSATKRARFEKRLKKRGLAPAVVGSMVCPVGVTTIKSKHPAAIAAGVTVDLLVRDEEERISATGLDQNSGRGNYGQ